MVKYMKVFWKNGDITAVASNQSIEYKHYLANRFNIDKIIIIDKEAYWRLASEDMTKFMSTVFSI